MRRYLKVSKRVGRLITIDDGPHTLYMVHRVVIELVRAGTITRPDTTAALLHAPGRIQFSIYFVNQLDSELFDVALRKAYTKDKRAGRKDAK